MNPLHSLRPNVALVALSAPNVALGALSEADGALAAVRMCRADAGKVAFAALSEADGTLAAAGGADEAFAAVRAREGRSGR
jgi:hypothetical protein